MYICTQSVHQGAAVLGIAMIAMGEPLGAQMAGRALEHLLQYAEPSVRCVCVCVCVCVCMQSLLSGETLCMEIPCLYLLQYGDPAFRECF